METLTQAVRRHIEAYSSKRDGRAYQRLGDALTKATVARWSDTKSRAGIETALRAAFPCLSDCFGEKGRFLTPAAAGKYLKIQSQILGMKGEHDEADFHGVAASFCLGLQKIYDLYACETNRNTSNSAFVIARKEVRTKNLCKFCFRPAMSVTYDTCHRHNPINNSAGYQRAKRAGKTTPPEVRLAWVYGRGVEVIYSTQNDDIVNKMMNKAYSDPDVILVEQIFNSLAGLTHKPLPAPEKITSGEKFHQALERAFDTGKMPFDYKFTLTWLPHAIEEVREEQEREAKAEHKKEIIDLWEKLNKKRGAQTEIARRLGVSRQYVSKILAEQTTN